jgi:hypothetical protein
VAERRWPPLGSLQSSIHVTQSLSPHIHSNCYYYTLQAAMTSMSSLLATYVSSMYFKSTGHNTPLL